MYAFWADLERVKHATGKKKGGQLYPAESVFFDVKDGELSVVATDSTIMAIATMPASYSEETTTRCWLAGWRFLIGYLKRPAKKDGNILCELHIRRATVLFTCDWDMTQIAFSPNDRALRWESMWNDVAIYPVANNLSFDPGLVSKIMKCAGIGRERVNSGNGINISLRSNGQSKKALIGSQFVDGLSMRYICMAMG